MPEVLIDCPSTGNPVPTGIAMSEELFASTTMRGNSVRCPHCQQMHTWDKEDAYLEEEKPT
jgi:hypothetical protein